MPYSIGEGALLAAPEPPRVSLPALGGKYPGMEQPQSPILAPPPLDRRQSSLFLDFDGTLVDLAERPDAVTVSVELGNLLERLSQRLGGRVALVSGRSLAQLDSFLSPWSQSVAMVGSHGAELRAPGAVLVATEPPAALALASREFADAFAGRPGVVIEVKTLGTAVHYRLDPSAEIAAKQLAGEFAVRHGLELQEGKMMVEVRSAGHDKGSGIAALMELAPFAGSVPYFLGDDLTDEAGFEACAATWRRGHSGRGPAPDQPPASVWRMSPPSIRWLAAQ